MRKIVATVAAGFMVAGGVLVAAPTASAYPAGADPAIRIVGSNALAPGDLSATQAVNYTPGCTATMKITRSRNNVEVAERTRTISSNTTATFAFRAPARAGQYIVRVKQVKEPGCAGFSSRTRFQVTR